MSDVRPAGCRILIVEDEYLIASGLRRALERAGASVLGPVPTVAEAVALLAATAGVDGAVLDINLGGEPVFPVADALRARGVPFVFTTGYSAEDVPPPYRGVPRVEKPASPAEILRALALPPG